MGLTVALIGCLVREAKGTAFSGTVATLGRQDIVASREQIVAAFVRGGMEPKKSLQVAGLNNRPVDDVELLNALGFSSIESVDISSYENATVVLDLNSPTTAQHLHNRYDCIIDSGTIEHVFDVPAALRHVHHMLKVGGRAIFFSPANNALEHGFYQICPTLYYDYFKANNYQINHMFLLRRAHDLYSDFQAFAYKPDEHDYWETAAIDDRVYLIWASVTKTDAATCDVVPLQHRYSEEQWIQHGGPAQGVFRRLLSRVTQPSLMVGMWKLRGFLKMLSAKRRAWRFRVHARKSYSFKVWGGT